MSHAQASDEETGLLLPFDASGEEEQSFDGLDEALDATPFAEESEFEDLSNRAQFLAGPTLRVGSSGKNVVMLQQALVKLGHATAINGQFDAATARALRSFQTRRSLAPDGVAGPRTKAAIVAAMGGAPVKPKPTGPTAKGRLVVDQHPAIRAHKGGGPDLILRWNDIQQPGAVDVVFHFHGFSGHGTAMRIDRHKEAISGLDFANPADIGETGRTQPTIGVLPRGNFYGGKSGAGFSFPALTKPGVVRDLVNDAVQRVSAATGHSLTLGRLILTGHSGGGAPIGAVVADVDPDEVHVFDGTYGSGKPISDWARKRIARELASPSSMPSALRVLFIPGTKSGTDSEARGIARALCAALHDPAAASLRARFRVDSTSVGHNDIPATFGWRLLADAGADLPQASTLPCQHAPKKKSEAFDTEDNEAWASPNWQPAPTAREQLEQESISMAVQGFSPGEEHYDSNEEYIFGEDRESLAWMDVEAEGEGGEHEAESFDNYDTESLDTEQFDENYIFEGLGDSEGFEPGESEYENAMESFEQLLDSEDEGDGFIERVKGLAAFVLGGNLKRGSKGAAVETLQRVLVRLGYAVGIDGDFGPGTDRAVRAFQKREGISVDGVCGPNTRKALADAINRGGNAPGPAPGPLPTPAQNSALANNIARIAKEELAKWHVNGVDKKEHMPEMTALLREYYTVATSDKVPSDANLQSIAWHKKNYWSAVFISYVMRRAGAGSGFAYSRAHRAYVHAAYRNRLNGNTRSPFWAYKPDEAAPQVGDLICNWRSHPDTTLENVNTKGSDGDLRGLHCDIVVEVSPGKLRVIGGNVRDDVGEKTVFTLPDGKIDLLSKKRKQSNYIAVVRCRGAIGSAAPAPQPSPPAAPSPAPTPGKKLTPAQFVATFNGSALASQARHGVPALVTLGQAALESGWGRAAPRFNFFGIKARATDPEATRQLLKTREVMSRPDAKFPEVISVTPRADGKYDYVVKDWFRAYSDAATSFDAHGAFLVNNKRYSKAFDVKDDPYAFADEVARAGYATGPDYATQLKAVMRMIAKEGGG